MSPDGPPPESIYGQAYAEAQDKVRSKGMPPHYLRELSPVVTTLRENFGQDNQLVVYEEGAGTGHLSRGLQDILGDRGFVIPTDINPAVMKISNIKGKELGIDTFETAATAEHKPLAEASVHLVVKAHVDEHLTLEQLIKSYRETARALKDGGFCVTFSPALGWHL